MDIQAYQRCSLISTRQSRAPTIQLEEDPCCEAPQTLSLRRQCSRKMHTLVQNPQTSCSKQLYHQLLEDKKSQVLDRIQKKIRFNRLVHKGNKNSPNKINILPQKSLEISHRKVLYQKFAKPISSHQINSHFQLIDKSQLLFKQQDFNGIEKNVYEVFWTSKMIKVLVVQNQALQIPKCSHPNLLKIYGRIKIKFFNYLIVQNLHGMSLKKLLTEFGPYTQRLIKQSIYQILQGVKKFHSKGKLFNILNLQNIYANEDGKVIIDSLKYFPSPCLEERNKNFYFCSPELLLQKKISEKNDVWSIGCIEIEGSDRLHPYNTVDSKSDVRLKTIKKMMPKNLRSGQNSVNAVRKSPLQFQISQQLSDLMEKCMCLDAQKRPSVEQLLEHPFFT